jgi:hypothetical protein
MVNMPSASHTLFWVGAQWSQIDESKKNISSNNIKKISDNVKSFPFGEVFFIILAEAGMIGKSPC